MLGGNTKRGTCIRQSTFYFHQPVFTSPIKPYMEWINYSRDPALWRSLRGNEAVSILKDYFFPTQQNSAQYRCFALLSRCRVSKQQLVAVVGADRKCSHSEIEIFCAL